VAEAPTPVVTIRAAWPDEGPRLKEIAIEAKSHWGYERERVIAWAEGGDFSRAGIEALRPFVAEVDGEAIGWAAVISKDGVAWLEDLWVDGKWIGRGVGRLLFAHALVEARGLGLESLAWEAEPNAVGFYERMGARQLREARVSSWGRTISVMGIDLNE
jgi:GNAT superfamily N-acetyltransferase